MLLRAGLGAVRLLESGSKGLKTLVHVVLAVSMFYAVGAYGHFQGEEALATFVRGRRLANERAVPFERAIEFLTRQTTVGRILVTSPAVPVLFVKWPVVLVEGPYGERPIDGVATIEEAVSRAEELRLVYVLDVATDRRVLGVIPALNDGIPFPPGSGRFALPRRQLEDRLIYEDESARVYRIGGSK